MSKLSKLKNLLKFDLYKEPNNITIRLKFSKTFL